MRSFTFFTAALAATVLAKSLPHPRSRGHTKAASNEIGVVEVKAHGQAGALKGVIAQMHGQANQVVLDEDGVVNLANGPERVIRRRAILPRN